MSVAIETFVAEFITKEGYKQTLLGLSNTALIAVFSLLIGFILGCIIAVIKLVPNERVVPRIFKKVCDIYVAVFRGTPIVVQLLLLHFAVFPALGLHFSDILEASIIFGLNSGAYISEIMRGGINSIDKGQMEAGRSLGLNYAQTMLRIIIPQAIKNILPTFGNEFITLIKETSVLTFIGITDLTRSFTAIAESTYEYFIPYIVLAIAYFIIVYLISLLVKFMERRMANDGK